MENQTAIDFRKERTENLTLLIPMYNKALYIERMVEGLSKQTYLPRTKIVVIDDASTDGSVEVLKRSAEKFHVPILLKINRVNIGLSLTIRDLNRSISTPFFTVLDPDDYYDVPDRLERAVKFLKEHPDYSMHACNYFRESPDGKKIPAIPESVPSFSISDYRQMPLLAVAGATFRNFYTPEILLEVDRIAGKSRFHFFDLDAFRHFLAVHLGKVYFDNFIGATYCLGVGMWDCLTQLEKDLINTVASYELFKFSRDFLHNAQTANFCLTNSYATYQRSAIEIGRMIQTLDSQKFMATRYCKEVLNLKTGDFDDILNVALYMGRIFHSLGIRK